MGIYDRDYYRKEGPSFLGSFMSTASVCKWLIIINVVVFLIQLLDMRGALGPRGEFTRTFDLNTGVAAWRLADLAPDLELENFRREDPEGFRAFRERIGRPGVLQGQVWRLLTYSFLHSPYGVFHILWNMLFLWWFGSELEQMYGSREFLAFYLVAALLGGVAFVLAQLAGIGGFAAAVGASGALTAVMVVYAFHFPTRTILLFFILPVPVWLMVIANVALDSFVFVSGAQTGTAVAVHLGGAAFGLAYYSLHLRLLQLLPDLRAWRARRNRPRLRVYREEEPVAVPAPRAPALDLERDEKLEAKVDAVLAKVARQGRESLTETERQILLRASEVYKKRRS